MYSITFYADPEDASVSENVGTPGTATWNDLVTGTGNTISSVSATTLTVRIQSEQVADVNFYNALTRAIFIFDTSTLPLNATIEDATVSIYGTNRFNANGIIPDINIVGSNPADPINLVAADFSTVGGTMFSTTVSYVSYALSGFNDFILNASGLSNIIPGGLSLFAARNVNYDLDDVAPIADGTDNTSLVGFDFSSADQTGTSQDPKLVVNFRLQNSQTTSY